MSEFQQSSGEQATATTYSRGRIRFYSVAKSSNLYGPESAPRACDPWLSIRSRKERATAKFRELLRLLLIRRRWRCSQPSFFTAEGHLDDETTRRRKSLPFALFRRILSRNCYLTRWLPRKFDAQVRPETEISEQVVEIIDEVSLNTACLHKNVDINFDYLYVFCTERICNEWNSIIYLLQQTEGAVNIDRCKYYIYDVPLSRVLTIEIEIEDDEEKRNEEEN